MKKQNNDLGSLYIVWAKVKGYPWWPATINTDPTTLDSHQKYRVDFFGQTSHSIIAGSMVHQFREKYEEFSGSKSKKLIQAIKLAQTFEKQLPKIKQQNTKPQKESPVVESIKHQENIIQQEEPVYIQPLPTFSNNPSKLEVSEGKKICEETQIVEVITSMKRIRSQRKFSQLQDPMYSPYKMNKHKTIKKLSRAPISSSNIFVIPYRRCYDPKYEVRIIDLLNKIHIGKFNENDIMRLIKRINNLDRKYLFNKYIVSGLVQILRMLEQKSEGLPTVGNLIVELKTKIQQLKKEIIMSLESTAQIEQEVRERDQSESDTPAEILEELSMGSQKKSFVQGVYRILKAKNVSKQAQTARKESLAIFGIFQRLLKRKKMGKVRDLLKDLIQREVNTQEMQRQLLGESESQGVKE